MIRTLSRCTMIALGWCAIATAAGADEVADVHQPPTIAATASAASDPCGGFDLTNIPGLRGTIISRVHPAQFSQGDQVTVCGRGLAMARFIENYRHDGTLQAGSFVEIGDETNKRGWWLQVFNVTTSVTGDRASFIAGGLFENHIERSSSGSSYYLVPAGSPGLRPAPNSTQGELRLKLSTSRFGPPKVVGPVVAWSTGGPKPRNAYGRFFNKKEPFVITPQGREQVISTELGLITIDGGNLAGATYRLGSVPLKTFPMPVEDGTSIIAAVPSNASGGVICASGSGEQKCLGPLAVQPGPTITKTPRMPLQLRTHYVIEGTDLKPSVPGLAYRVVMSGLTGAAECGQVLKVSEHTARRIQFSLGDVEENSPIPEDCARAANYQTPQTNPSNLILLVARYKNQERPIYQLHYYLSQRQQQHD